MTHNRGVSASPSYETSSEFILNDTMLCNPSRIKVSPNDNRTRYAANDARLSDEVAYFIDKMKV